MSLFRKFQIEQMNCTFESQLKWFQKRNFIIVMGNVPTPHKNENNTYIMVQPDSLMLCYPYQNR